MKTQNRMKILLILVAIWAIGIFTAQQLLLPQLREQVALGLKSGLDEIGAGIASGLSQFYEAKIEAEFAIIKELNLDKINIQNINQLEAEFIDQIDFEQLPKTWAIAFPDSTAENWRTYEYAVAPNRKSFEWIEGKWFGKVLNRRLATAYPNNKNHQEYFWQRRIDSTIVLFEQIDAFSPSLEIICEPIFKDGELMAFLCFSVNNYYVTNDIIPAYFENEFWPKGVNRKDGIQKDFLDINIRDGKGNMIFNSQILSRGTGEVSKSISQVSPYLSLYTVNIGFWGKTSREVAASLHQRNFWMVNGVFFFFLLMLGLIYWTFQKSLRLDKLKIDFMANISHELKSPLSAIKMANDTLRFDRIRTPKEGEKVSGIIQDEVIRLERMITRLLDFSQLEAGKRIYQKGNIELGEWWKEWSEKKWEKIHLSGFDLEISDNQFDSQIYMDSEAIEEVLEILLDNAMKYSGDSRKLNLNTQITKEYWQISVQDFGMGISPKDQGQVFEKFLRLEDSETHNVKGHGLGLSIAKSIVEAHEGEISVKSELGKGSAFMVKIPLNV